MGYAVRFEEVSKRYARGAYRYASLRQDLSDGVHRIGQRLRGRRPEPRGALALDGVSFEVAEGESFAIVGPNGAGKTTALKLVARISYPSSGRLRVRGRVGALIEVGSGIHPELTGRENVWFYGQILGMSRAEVQRRFDEIVEFAELGHVLDVPVKRYSSGMQLRLGFAVAAYLNPEVFVVDEALAVGDATFQAKCVERMTELVSEGRTLLFVSHHLSAVEAICNRGVFLLGGTVAEAGEIKRVMARYLDWIDQGEWARKSGTGAVRGQGMTIERVTCHGADGAERYSFESGERIEVRFHVAAEREIPGPWFSLGISDGRPGALALCSMLEGERAPVLAPGRHTVSCRLGPLPLGPRTYELWSSVREPSGVADLVAWSQVGAIRIQMPRAAAGRSGVTLPWQYGPVRVDHHWTVEDGEVTNEWAVGDA